MSERANRATLSPRGEIVAGMCRALAPQATAELHRALAAELAYTPTAAEAQLHELGLLAQLLETDGTSFGDVRVVDRKLYDERRTNDSPESPRSRNLVDRYGCWTDVCQAADGLQPDGRSTGPSVPWPVRAPHPRKREPWTREQVMAAVRACADDLMGREPTSWIYAEWVRRRRAKARELGVEMRLPHLPTVYRSLVPEADTGRTRWRVVLDSALGDDDPAS